MSKKKTQAKHEQGPSQTGLVFFEDRSNHIEAANEILSQLPPVLVTDEPAQAEFILTLTEDHLHLQLNQPNAPGAIYADFATGKARHRLGQGELIYRAMGLSKHQNPKILDATAGLGRDAFVLASKGCRVTLIERSPLIFVLLKDALTRAHNNRDIREIVERMSAINMDAETYLNSETLPQFDMIYLDPMYPERKKSALVKKEMQIFQHLLGKKEKVKELFQLALDRAKHRVVVKRPLKGEYLNNLKPEFFIKGKSIRFDVYLSI